MLRKKATWFDYLNYTFLILLSITIIYPFYSLMIISFSKTEMVAGGGLRLWITDGTLANYEKVLSSSYISSGYKNSLIRTILGTVIQLFVTTLGAYVLSKKFYPHRTFWTMFIVFTMFFSGGLIPTYLLVNSLGLFNTYAVMILPSLISAFNMILMRNYFMSLPDELEESCLIDGAGWFTILFKIIVPISKPILATIGLWLAVGHWNAWFDILLYIQDDKMFTLQIVLRRIILQGTQQMVNINMVAEADIGNISTEGVKAATIFVATLPILCVYPFIQKYFVKGIMIGSLKG